MGPLLFLLAPVYITLIVFGFKATWKLASNILAGSSEIVLPIILFVLMILVVGPIMGIVNIIKWLILYAVSQKQNKGNKQNKVSS